MEPTFRPRLPDDKCLINLDFWLFQPYFYRAYFFFRALWTDTKYMYTYVRNNYNNFFIIHAEGVSYQIFVHFTLMPKNMQ